MSRNGLIPRPSAVGKLVDNVESHFNRLIDDFFAPPSILALRDKVKNNTGYPKIDIFTNKSQYCMEATVSGVKPDDITVEILTEDGTKYVRISGHMSEDYCYKDEETDWRMKEICRRAFTRMIPIPDTLEGDPEAKIKDGILSLTWTLPKEMKPIETVKVIPLKKD